MFLDQFSENDSIQMTINTPVLTTINQHLSTNHILILRIQ
jgi:hypothetical protein